MAVTSFDDTTASAVQSYSAVLDITMLCTLVLLCCCCLTELTVVPVCVYLSPCRLLSSSRSPVSGYVSVPPSSALLHIAKEHSRKEIDSENTDQEEYLQHWSAPSFRMANAASQRELDRQQQQLEEEEDEDVVDDDMENSTTSSLTHLLRHPITAFNDAYSGFLFANAQRLNKVESTARSLTWFVPAQSLSSEGTFTALNLLTLYHDALSNRPSGSGSGLPYKSNMAATAAATTLCLPVSPHSRYTKYWIKQSKLYKAVARLLSVVSYSQLLLEMAGKKYKGEAGRWRVVIGLESLK